MIGDGTSINVPAAGVQTIAFVPEPSTWILMGIGFGALAFAAARKARAA
jgi:PEP-CTERM motif